MAHGQPGGAKTPRRGPRGTRAPRRLDHLNILCRDVAANSRFLTDTLGFRLIEQIVIDDRQTAAWMSVTPQPHDIALTTERSDTPGRLHHITYAMDTREDVLRAADI